MLGWLHTYQIALSVCLASCQASCLTNRNPPKSSPYRHKFMPHNCLEGYPSVPARCNQIQSAPNYTINGHMSFKEDDPSLIVMLEGCP